MRILIGRVGSLLLAVFLSAWSLTLGALDWLGRIMLMHDYDQALQRLPQWAGWLFSTPWWVPAILASVLTCFLIWLSWPRTQAVMPAIAAATANPPLREVPSASLAATHLQSKRILSDAIVVDGDEDRLPEFRGRFAEN